MLTQLLEHFVAFVEDEMLEMLQIELLAPDQGQDPARSAHHDMRAVGLEHLLVLGDGQAAEEDADFDALSVLGEPLVLLADLEGQLSGVAHDQDTHLAVHGLNLLESCQDEDGRLAHSGLGLAEDVHAQDGLRDAFVLH